MTAPVRPQTDPNERIRTNVAKMRAQGAPDADVEHYLQDVEGLKPVASPDPAAPTTPASPTDRLRASLARGAASESTAASPLDQSRRAAAAARPGMVSGLARSAEQGATFGFGDELNAGVRSLFPGQTYDEAVADERTQLGQFREDHPVMSFGAEIGGGLAGGGALGAGARALGVGARAASSTAQASKLARTLKQLGTGAAAGAVAGAGAADGDLADRVQGAAVGSVFGGATVGGAKLVGAIARPVANGARNLLPQRLQTALGAPAPIDAAKADILKQLERAGMTVRDVEQAAAAGPPEAMLLDVGGQPLLRRARGAQSIPSKGSNDIEGALRERVAEQPGRVQGKVAAAVAGGPRENQVSSARALIAQRKANAQPLYETAYGAAPVSDPAIGEALKIPEFRAAYERGRRLAALDRVKIPSLVTDEERAAAAARGEPRKLILTDPVRDPTGTLRRDLSTVPNEHLEVEWRRLAELNAEEEAMHAGVQDAHYRADYEELPHTEKFGLKGQEDLPDADGMVDADRLAADNKVVTDYRKSKIVRSARQRAMDRIQGELDRRVPPGADPTDFEFGANAASEQRDTPHPVPVAPSPSKPPRAYPTQALDYMKRGLDDLIRTRSNGESAIGHSEARALRNRMAEVLDAVDVANPDYKMARSQFAGDSQLIDAHERGTTFLKESHDELAADWPAMTPGERALYRRGALSALSEQLSKVTDGRDVTRIFQNPLMREKLRTILPDQASANTFMKQLADETGLHKNAQFVLSGSPTARIGAEQADDVGADAEKARLAFQAMAGNWKGAAMQAASNAAKRAGGLTPARVDALAPYLTARGPALAKALRELEDASTRTASSRPMSPRALRAFAQTLAGRVNSKE